MTPIDPASGRADNPPALGPAGTVHASLEDYAKFLRVFLTDGGGWLSPDSLRRLTTPVPGEGGQPYALGWIVLPDRSWSGGAPVLTHDGSNTMWLARAIVAPGRRAAAICVANAYEPARPAIDGLTQALIAAFPS
jgi:CubicO group peptidase (beta-lactamase class C family)